ncbi:hypothetical protein BMS3Bbin02_02050 [bacterium BMS3Bbin02]|nr:hypothetical protein BMS3Bbin02_02050 [bacterium BMS3Bbin02]
MWPLSVSTSANGRPAVGGRVDVVVVVADVVVDVVVDDVEVEVVVAAVVDVSRGTSDVNVVCAGSAAALTQAPKTIADPAMSKDSLVILVASSPTSVSSGSNRILRVECDCRYRIVAAMVENIRYRWVWPRGGSPLWVTNVSERT